MSSHIQCYHQLLNNIQKVIIGKEETIRNLICCWVTGGHVLLEDVPGTGKTILARSLARSSHVKFKRVQFTPDLLPSDIIGTSIYNQKTAQFHFVAGPVFTVILLADEINRATPRTQSALLECMSEKQVSTEGSTYKLDSSFFTIATQNPVDQLGTFSLPEAQLDRFTMKLSLGYPSQMSEIDIMKNQNQKHPIQDLEPVIEAEQILELKNEVPRIKIGDEIYKFITDIIKKTRSSEYLKLGASPRATLALAKCSQALALFEEQNYVSPKHVVELAHPVIAHRLIPSSEARMAGMNSHQILTQIMESVTVPVQKE